ncbi:MAG: alpha/beta fold hydrolase [Eubacteriales bacterium]|nr:alpha/beta fold hydrolase [Eubacteriales bacterium]
MIKQETKSFKSSDGITDIHVLVWYPDEGKYEKPVGVLQISHGMVDHIERFSALAEYMADKGFVVAGNDHLGHGDSVVSKDKWGYFSKKESSSTVVNDLYHLTRIMKKKYPGLPYFLVGHSMGSFMARRYAMEHGGELTGLLILGTGNQPSVMVNGGLVAANIVGFFKGEEYRSTFLKYLMFGAYNKRIVNPRSDNDWITSDDTAVDMYNSDPKCSYTFTVNGIKGLLSTIRFIKKKSNIAKIPKNLPVIMASGLEDPVGGYGRDVRRLYEIYTHYIDDMELRLYEGCRHELHNEKNKEEVFSDLWEWMKLVYIPENK